MDSIVCTSYNFIVKKLRLTYALLEILRLCSVSTKIYVTWWVSKWLQKEMGLFCEDLNLLFESSSLYSNDEISGYFKVD
jgi:hypothetical protein